MENNGTSKNVEVLATQIQALTTQVNKLEAKLDAYATHFITAEVYELKHRELEMQLSALTAKVELVNKGNTARMWTLGTISATAGILLAYLVQFYLDHVGGK